MSHEGIECPVCFNNTYMTKTNCNHPICVGCLMNLKKIECPLCRRQLQFELPKNLLNYLQKRTNKTTESILIDDLGEFPPL